MTLGDALNGPPYKAPPKAPILYVKPRNTLIGHRANIAVPDDSVGVQVGGSLGIVIGRTASRVSAAHALEFVESYTIVADLCVPHEGVYRPSVRYRVRDGFCAIDPALVAKRHVPNPDAPRIEVGIEGKPTFIASAATSIGNVAQLVADVTDFMTLAPSDVLTMGLPHGSSIAHAGEAISVAIGQCAPLYFYMTGKAHVGGER